jgi:glycosyltransferase involved in cell wall biosynthesis
MGAMAVGKAVVATDVGGNSEVIVNGETGFLVPPKDPASLASKMIVLLGDTTPAHQFGMQAQKRITEYFSRERMVDSYQQLYEAAIGER